MYMLQCRMDDSTTARLEQLTGSRLLAGSPMAKGTDDCWFNLRLEHPNICPGEVPVNQASNACNSKAWDQKERILQSGLVRC